MDSSAAVIGTREPDGWQVKAAARLTRELSSRGWQMWTGGAKGIDQVCMENTPAGQLNVVLPWSSYNQAIVPAHAKLIVLDRQKHVEWYASVNDYHPAASKLSDIARAFHARNYGIIVNRSLVFAFPDENGGGGTGQGIRIAHGLKIQLFECRRGSMVGEEAALKLMNDLLGDKGTYHIVRQ